MNVLQNVTALFRSPDAAVMAAQAVQAGDLAAKQAALSLQRDSERRREQVLAGEALSPSETAGERRQHGEERLKHRAGGRAAPPGTPPVDAPRRRVDIIA